MCLAIGRTDPSARATAYAGPVIRHHHHAAFDISVVLVLIIDNISFIIDPAQVMTPRPQTLKQRPQPIQTAGLIERR